MKLIISFAGRANGNCDSIANFIAERDDKKVFFRDLNVHACSNCEYECITGECKYRGDDSYKLYESMLDYEKIILIVPMYCSNPASLYFTFHERCQDFFMHREECYEEIISRLFIIGVYGSDAECPAFLSVFEKWFVCSQYTGHVFGIERHKYGQMMGDDILDVEEVRSMLSAFVNKEICRG